MDNILGLALAASMIAKTVVDLAKLGADLPRWGPPSLAALVGIGAVVLLMVSQETALTLAALAGAVLAGILAGGAAVGVTELGRRVDQVQATRRG